jgi:hypothetical protein
MADSARYDNLRDNLNEGLASLSDKQLENRLAMAGMDAEAMEGFFDDLGKFAAKAAPSILPIAGTVLGTAVGGPIGAQLGGTLGSLAGKAVGAATGQPAAGGGLGGGGSAASQLLQTITKPETIQAVASMAMGAMGKSNVSVGGTSVPISAFANLLGTLVGKAQAEYAEARSSAEGDGTPPYMKDYAGQPVSDPAVPLNRAVALYQLLQNAPRDSEGEDDEAEAAELDMESMQAEYDEMELLEMESMELEESEY